MESNLRLETDLRPAALMGGTRLLSLNVRRLGTLQVKKENTVEEASGTQQTGIVGVFSRAAATYDRIGPRFFAYFGQRLVAQAHLAPGAAVLDVAAGRGAVLFPAAQQVSPGGRVIGIDLSADMVRETTADIHARWVAACHDPSDGCRAARLCRRVV